MNSAREQVEFITRLAYNIDGLSGPLKLYFSQFLSFHFGPTLSIEQIENIENKRASIPFTDDDSIIAFTQDFTEEEKVWIIAALLILKSKAAAGDDRVFSIKLNALIDRIIKLLKLQEDTSRILIEQKRLEAEALRFQNRKLIRVPVKISPLIADYLLRCLTLFGTSFMVDGSAPLLVLNIFFIPILILLITYRLRKQNLRHNHTLLEAYGGEANFKLEHQISTGQYTWLAFFLSTGVYIAYLLPEQVYLIAFFAFTFYYYVIIRFLLIGRIDENELVKQIEADNQNLLSLNRDENDEVIIDLETKLNSFTGRLEAYVLESALFGALTFSGFLQIMSSELISFDALEQFAKAIFNASRAIIQFNDVAYWSAAAKLNNKVSLFCLVSVESLLCSVFFLAVIASRLRFSNVADEVRTAINLAKVYNTKEEAFYHEEDVSEKKSLRLAVLNAKVNEQLQASVIAMRKVEPVMTYMQYFRNAGILVFLVILLSSTLFITNVIGWAFLSLVLATYLYFNREAIGLWIKISYLDLRIQFSRKGQWLFMIAFSPFIMSLVFSDWFHWVDKRIFDASRNVLVGIYLFLWLYLSAQVDNEFGAIEKTADSQRMGRWKIVKNLLGGLILFYCIALAMKVYHMTGANALAMLSLSMVGLLAYLVGYYLSKIRWLGIVMGGMLAVVSIGILFKTLHLPGASEMLRVSIFALAILIPVIVWQRKKFHVLFLKICAGAFLFSIIFYFSVFFRLEVAASHHTIHIGKILEVDNYKLDTDFKQGLKESDWYIAEYGTRPGPHTIYAELIRQYRSYCTEEVLRDWEGGGVDSTLLQNGLLAARQSNKIQDLFGYDPDFMYANDLELEADVLLALNRKQEAVESLKKKLTMNLPQSTRDRLKRKLDGIKL